MSGNEMKTVTELNQEIIELKAHIGRLPHLHTALHDADVIEKAIQSLPKNFITKRKYLWSIDVLALEEYAQQLIKDGEV